MNLLFCLNSSPTTNDCAPLSEGSSDKSDLTYNGATISESDPTTALSKIVCFAQYPELIRRGGVMSTIKNLTFDLRSHSLFLDPEDPNHIATTLLVPLAPANIADDLLSDENMDDISPWLLSLSSEHFIEGTVQLKRTILEALLVLACTYQGRASLKSLGAYYVIRAFHKAEIDVACRVLAERLVDLLIRDESEECRRDGDTLDSYLQCIGKADRDEELEAILAGEVNGSKLEVEYDTNEKSNLQ
jgi:hypothetical protein